MSAVGDLRGTTCLRRAGEEEELLALMRGEISQDAAIARAVEEPRRAADSPSRCGPRPTVCTTLADRARLDEIARLDRRARREALANRRSNRSLPSPSAPSYFCQLLERDHARLVDHVVLAVPHASHAATGARSLGMPELKTIAMLSILENPALVVDAPRLRIAGGRRTRRVRPPSRRRKRIRRPPEKEFDLAEDMVVIDPDDREADGVADRHFARAPNL